VNKRTKFESETFRPNVFSIFSEYTEFTLKTKILHKINISIILSSSILIGYIQNKPLLKNKGLTIAIIIQINEFLLTMI